MRARSIITRVRGVTGFMAGNRNRSRLCHLVGMLQVAGLSCLCLARLQAAPIRAHPANPHYFEFRGQPTLLITSAEHYGAVINPDFDWERYLQTLARDGMNYTRGFAGSYVEGEQDIGWMLSSNTLAPRPGKLLAPWARSDVAGYHNGGNKFDLDRWDDRYFARLKGFVRSAGQKGVVVEITLFGNQYGDSQWAHSPLKASNNIQAIGGRWEDFQTLRDPPLTRRQADMVRKIVTELRDADNVIYEISNEPFNNGVDPTAVNEWHRHLAAVIAKEEQALGVKHLVAANEAVHDDPNVSMLNWHYVANLARLDDEYALGKPIVLDETNGSLIHAGVDDVRVEAWEWICGGGAGYNNLSWEFTPNDPTGAAGATVRRQLKVLREFASTLDFVRMKPAPEIISRPLADGVFARALVEPGRTCWIYLHHSRHRKYGTFVTGYEAQPGTHRDSLELALPPSRYQMQWFRPRDGTLLREDRVKHEGAKLRLASPDSADADITAVIRSEPTTATGSIEPGTDIQAVVDANPAGTTYRLGSGIHRLQSVVPKSQPNRRGSDLPNNPQGSDRPETASIIGSDFDSAP